MFPSFDRRSLELEHLDKGDYTPAEYEGCLVELRRINRFLGDASALRRTLLNGKTSSRGEPFSVLDVGAGSGELLRVIATHLRDQGKKSRLLVGLDFNRRSAASILEESREHEEIASLRGDALRLPFADGAFDYVICSLFTHHFRDEGVVAVLREMARVARFGLLVIDLHRHRAAYLFYTTLGRLFLRNRLTREDGALSILRGFRSDELLGLAHEANLRDAVVKRLFPFRLVLSAKGSSNV